MDPELSDSKAWVLNDQVMDPSIIALNYDEAGLVYLQTLTMAFPMVLSLTLSIPITSTIICTELAKIDSHFSTLFSYNTKENISANHPNQPFISLFEKETQRPTTKITLPSKAII